MGKEKTMETVKLEKHGEIFPLIVGEVKKSIPMMRSVKSKEKIKVTTMKSNSTADKCTTTCETSGNIMKLCINLMPALASAKEPVEEEDEGQDGKKHKSCINEPELGNCRKKHPSDNKLVEQTLSRSDAETGLTLNKETENKQQLSPHFVLPPLTLLKPAPVCCGHQKTKRFVTPVSPTMFEQTGTISPNFTTKSCSSDGDSRPWVDDPLLSKSVSRLYYRKSSNIMQLHTNCVHYKEPIVNLALKKIFV